MTQCPPRGVIRAQEGNFFAGDQQFDRVDSPLAIGGVALVQMFAEGIDEADARLSQLVAKSRSEGAGKANIIYRLAGAIPSVCTPMEYGGLFLERDREILEEFVRQSNVFVYVQGGEGVYLDFVSDLPGQILGWNCVGSGYRVESIRAMRNGLLAAASPDADYILEPEFVLAMESLPIG